MQTACGRHDLCLREVLKVRKKRRSSRDRMCLTCGQLCKRAGAICSTADPPISTAPASPAWAPKLVGEHALALT